MDRQVISTQQRAEDMRLLFEPKLRKPDKVNGVFSAERMEALRRALSEDMPQLSSVMNIAADWEERAQLLDINTDQVARKIDQVTGRLIRESDTDEDVWIESPQANQLPREKDLLWQSAYAVQVAYAVVTKSVEDAAKRVLSDSLASDRHYTLKAVRISVIKEVLGDLNECTPAKLDAICRPFIEDPRALEESIRSWRAREIDKKATWKELIARIPVYMEEILDLKRRWEERAAALDIPTEPIQTKIDMAMRRTDHLVIKESSDRRQDLAACHSKKQHNLLWLSVYVIEIIDAVMTKRIRAVAQEEIGRGNKQDLDFHVQTLVDTVLRELHGDVVKRSPYTLASGSEPLYCEPTQLKERVWAWIETDLEASIGAANDVRENVPKHLEELANGLRIIAGIHRMWQNKERTMELEHHGYLDPNQVDRDRIQGNEMEAASELQAREEDWNERVQVLEEHTMQLIWRTTGSAIEHLAQEALEHPSLVMKRDQIRRLEHDLFVRLGTAATKKTVLEVHKECIQLLKELEADKQIITEWIRANSI